MADSPLILIVDERGFSRITIARYLTGSGYRVVQAPDCMEGLRQLGAQTFSLVIVDHKMEKMNGFQFLEAARSIGLLGSGPTTVPPFVMMSDQTEESLVREALSVGFGYVFSKSINETRLAEIVKGILNAQSIKPEFEIPPEELERRGSAPPPVEAERKLVIHFERFKARDNGWYYTLTGTLSKGTGFPDLFNSIKNSCTGEDKSIILDLSRVSYVNSTGVSGLLNLCKQVRAAGGEFKLVNAQEQVQQVLENLDLLNVFAYEAGYPHPTDDPIPAPLVNVPTRSREQLSQEVQPEATEDSAEASPSTESQ